MVNIGMKIARMPRWETPCIAHINLPTLDSRAMLISSVLRFPHILGIDSQLIPKLQGACDARLWETYRRLS